VWLDLLSVADLLRSEHQELGQSKSRREDGDISVRITTMKKKKKILMDLNVNGHTIVRLG
jgi:hypothetical protein